MSPQSTPERRAKWGIPPDKAMEFLESRGYRLTKQWTWIMPADRAKEQPDGEESDAIVFLIEEWDFGGLD